MNIYSSIKIILFALRPEILRLEAIIQVLLAKSAAKIAFILAIMIGAETTKIKASFLGFKAANTQKHNIPFSYNSSKSLCLSFFLG